MHCLCRHLHYSLAVRGSRGADLRMLELKKDDPLVALSGCAQHLLPITMQADSCAGILWAQPLWACMCRSMAPSKARLWTVC